MNDRSFYENFPATAFLLLFICGFFLLEVIAHMKADEAQLPILSGVRYEVVQQLGALSFSSVRDGKELWRLVAYAFLHGGVVHLLFNCVVLADVGRFCEPLLSTWKFVVYYAICAVGAGLASMGWHYLQGGGMSVGASGALSGLIGLMLTYSVRERHHGMRDMLIRWVLAVALIGFLIPGIDNAGHAGGFVTGLLLGFTVRDYLSSGEVARWIYPGYAAAFMMAVCLGFALFNHFVSR